MKSRWVARVLGVASALSSSVSAQEPPPYYEYAVKFVCGTAESTAVAPGSYFTAINVFNPSGRRFRFFRRVVVALPDGAQGSVLPPARVAISGGYALEIDCPEILRAAESKGTFLKGFVVLDSPMWLDVVAVYTAAGAAKQVETLHTERVYGWSSDFRPPIALNQPDLVPQPRRSRDFCVRDAEGRLVVTVKNQGESDAGSSITRVTFPKGQVVTVPTPAIRANESVQLSPIPIPSGCFDPDCSFTIQVDSDDQVDEEFGEGNNTAQGVCIG